LIQKREQRKEEEGRMCKALDDLVAEGEQKGRAEGKIEGRIEGKIEGRIEGKAEFVLELLEECGTVPDNVKEAILKQTDISVLKKWHKLAAHVESIEEFIQQSCAV